jgi:glycosyltransferase involved in cell wall biosynthesis
MISRKIFWFIGELPTSQCIHGIAAANSYLLDYLFSHGYDCRIFIDNPFYSRRLPLRRLCRLVSLILVLFKLGVALIASIIPPTCFAQSIGYCVLSQGYFGAFKTLIFLLILRLNNHTILHIHRSDLLARADPLRMLLLFCIFCLSDFILVITEDKHSVLSSPRLRQFIPKLFYLPNTIDFELESVLFSSSRSMNLKPLDSEPLRLLFLSNLLKTKGFDIFLDLHKSFLHSGGHESMVAGAALDFEFLDLISISGLKYLGSVSDNLTKSYLLNSAHLLIFPSQNEGLPLCVLEAMAIGLPVICSRVGYIQELLGFDYPLYADFLSTDSYACAISKFRDMTFSEIDSLSQLLRSRYVSRFSSSSWTCSVDSFFSLFY